jgi:hypothetical protein
MNINDFGLISKVNEYGNKGEKYMRTGQDIYDNFTLFYT